MADLLQFMKDKNISQVEPPKYFKSFRNELREEYTQK